MSKRHKEQAVGKIHWYFLNGEVEIPIIDDEDMFMETAQKLDKNLVVMKLENIDQTTVWTADYQYAIQLPWLSELLELSIVRQETGEHETTYHCFLSSFEDELTEFQLRIILHELMDMIVKSGKYNQELRYFKEALIRNTKIDHSLMIKYRV